MAQITSGKVIFGRTVQPAQYESKKAEVEISFVVADGEGHEEILNKAAAIAQAKCLELVGLKSGPAATADKKVETAPAASGRTKADIEKETIAAAAPKAQKASRPPRAVSDAPEDRKPEEPANDLGDIFGEEEAPAVIDDKTLLAEITAHNNKVKNAVAIKALVAKYGCTAPKRAQDLPQDKRAAFIEDLKKIKAPEAA